MNIKTSLKKLGSSFHFLLPKSIVDVYNLEKNMEDYEWSIRTYNNGNTISFKRVKKQTAQEILDNINTEIKDED